MRLSCLLAVLSAVLSAAGANACCFLNCWKSAAPQPVAAAVAAPAGMAAAVVKPVTDDGPIAFYVKIVSVGGQAPDATGHIPNPVDPQPYVKVIVETDGYTGQYWTPGLVVDPFLPLPGPGMRAMADAKKPKVVAVERRKKAVKKAMPKTADAAPTTTDDTAYEFEYRIEGLTYDSDHTIYAYQWLGWWWIFSDYVYFHTKAAPPSPPPSPPVTPGLKTGK